MPDLVTRDEVKALLGIETANTTKDTQIDGIIPHIETAVANWICLDYVGGSHPLTEVEVTQFVSGQGQERFKLPRRPLVSISELKVDLNGYSGQASGAFPDTSIWVAGTDFHYDLNGWLYPLRGGKDWKQAFVWPSQAGSIKATYTAGYSSIPEDIKWAVSMFVGAAMNRAGVRSAGLLSSDRQGRTALTWANDGKNKDLNDAWAVIQNYKAIS